MGKPKNENKILNVLKELNSPISTTDLSIETGISLSNITRYLKKLEREGIIEREERFNKKTRYIMISLLQ